MFPLHYMKDFHYLHKETPQKIQTPILFIRGGTKPMHKANYQHKREGTEPILFYTRGGHKAKCIK